MPEATAVSREERVHRYVELDALSNVVANLFLPLGAEPLLEWPAEIEEDDLALRRLSAESKALWPETGTSDDPLDFELADARVSARMAAIFAALAERPDWVRGRARYFAELSAERLRELTWKVAP